MKRRLLFPLLLIAGLGLPFLPVFGQYDLSEVGIMAGGGYSLNPGVEKLSPGPGANANAFFSYWNCGKNHGIHASLGARYFQATAQEGFYPNPPEPASPKTGMNFTALDAGFYFKVRLHEYHRPREWSFLMGPKLNLLVNSGLTSNTGNTAFEDLGVTRKVFSAGVHLSARYKIKLNTQFLYLQPGAEYYPLPYLDTSAGATRNLYLFFNVGGTLWNTKQKSYKRK